MSTKQYLFTTLILIAACIGTWLLLMEIENRAIPLTKNNRPDSFMLDVTATRMDEAGLLKDKLQSPQLLHYAEGDTTDIKSPHFIIYNLDNTGEPWYIHANYGKAHHGIVSIDLWDQVRLEQPAGLQNAATTMITSAITIFPKPQFAQTNQPVKVLQAGSIVTAVGLHADLKSGEIDLLSQAHGKYQPAPINNI